MALSPCEKDLESAKAKELMRMAVLKRPQSIESIKRSFFINNSKVQDFVRHIKYPFTEAAQSEEGQLITNIHEMKKASRELEGLQVKGKDIFLKRNNKHYKHKQQLKVQRSNIQLEPPSEGDNCSQMSINQRKESRSQRVPSFATKSAKVTAEAFNKNKMRNTFSINLFKSEEVAISKSMKFWKRTDKGPHTHHRWKTEGEDRIGDRSLGELTRFCEKRNNKGLNYLALQLQLNVEDSRRIRVKTGV